MPTLSLTPSFDRLTSHDWFQLGNDIDGSYYEFLGFSTSFSGDGNRLALGAPYGEGFAYYSGNVQVYEYNPSSTSWDQVGADIGGEYYLGEFGVSISLSEDGTIVAIGASAHFGTEYYTGEARVYVQDGTDWEQMGGDIRGEEYYDQFGTSVSLSSDGLRIAVGAPLNNATVVFDDYYYDDTYYYDHTGHARVFGFTGTDWVQIGEDIDGEYCFDKSGTSLSFSNDGKKIAIGSPGYYSYIGHVRVFEEVNSEWIQIGNIIEGEEYDDESGTSVSFTCVQPQPEVIQLRSPD